MLLSSPLHAQNTDAWQENLDFLVQEIPQRHVDPFHNLSQAEFEAQAAALRAEMPTLSDEAIAVKMAQWVASLGDSHTVLVWQNTSTFYPLGMSVFSDGVGVLTTITAYEQALGTRLIAIEGIPIADVTAQLATLIPHENEAWLHAQLPNFLNRADVLRGLGIVQTAEAAEFTFETFDNEIFTLEITPLPLSELQTMEFLRALPAEQIPLTLRTRPAYWYTYFEESQILFFKYNTAIDLADQPFAPFMEELLHTLQEQPVEKLVVDVRDNTGGNSALLTPLIEAVYQQTDLQVFVIIGQYTFSSAVLNAIQLQERAILVGQPTGGKPNHYGEVKSVALPHFGMQLFYSTNYFAYLTDSDPLTLTPDVLVEFTLADYLMATDPFFEAVVSYRE